jgi:hypothetical protein
MAIIFYLLFSLFIYLYLFDRLLVAQKPACIFLISDPEQVYECGQIWHDKPLLKC